MVYTQDWLAKPSYLAYERNIKIVMKIKFAQLEKINQRVPEI
jgi:hypothetical protein